MTWHWHRWKQVDYDEKTHVATDKCEKCLKTRRIDYTTDAQEGLLR